MMKLTTPPIKRQNLAAEVAKRLQEQIAKGDYAIDQKLPTEPELMEQFGVGRSSIREAVRLLLNAGLVRVQQGLGTFVASLQPLNDPLSQRLQQGKYDELNEVRVLLEGKIAEKAALNRTIEDIEKMKQFLKDRKTFGKANNAPACIKADIHFHITIAEASKNSIMLDLYKTIALQMKQSFIERFTDTTTFTETQDLHESLLQSIIDRDAKKVLTWVNKIALNNQ
ncbi:FadR/GntR family transcriptional regulator [Chitinophagaceae bacterium LWZ2-11]